ncbi:MAG: hypothetical protein ABIA78_03600, partial [archaeon]
NATDLTMAQGSHTVTYYCNDTGNNLNNSESVTFFVDSIKPDINITTPLNNTNWSNVNLDVNYTTSDINLASCWYSNDTNSVNTTLTNCGANITTVVWSEGEHNVTVWSNDSAGNSNSSMVFFTIDTTPPTITLISPANQSADSDGNITFNYNVSDMLSVSNCSLILNGTVNQTNLSITKDVVQNFTVNNLVAGAYNWYVNCTDAVNNINKSATRKVSVVKVVTFSGATTNLSAVSNISAVPNLTIEAPEYGKLNFTDVVDLSNGSDIDTFVNVSFNRIEINSSALPALDKPARLALYNLTFSDPRVLKDGVECSASVCTEVGYTGGIFEFDVTGFSVYSAGETPVTATTSTTSSGGSSGGGSAKVAPKNPVKFDLGTEMYEKAIILNRVELDIITLTNNDKTDRYFEISLENLKDIVSIEENSFTVLVGETKDIEFKITAPENPGVYTGKIIVNTADTVKEILVMLNVKSEKSLFDITLSIPNYMKSMTGGRNLKAQINLLQMGIKEKMDVTLHYSIKDFSGNVFLAESETIAVYEEKSLDKEFYTQEFVPGDYVLGIELVYPDGVAVASSHFKIKDKIEFGKEEAVMTGLIFVLIFVSIIIVLAIKRYKRIGRLLKSKKRR